MDIELKRSIESVIVSLARIDQNIVMISELQKDQETRIRNIETHLNQNYDNKIAISKNSESIKRIEDQISRLKGALIIIVPLVSMVGSWLQKLFFG